MKAVNTLIFPAANDWVISNKELTEKTKYTITGLSPGCKILVRVKAINAAGASAPRTLQHSILVKEVIGEQVLEKCLLYFLPQFSLKVAVNIYSMVT